MLRVISALLVTAVVVALAWVVAHLPGHVSARFGSIAVEAATPVFVLALAALVLASYLLFRLVALVLRLPRRMRERRAVARRRAGDEAVTRALVAIAAGDTGSARRESARARRNLGDTPQTLLLAAQAGRLAGREDEAEALYRQIAERPDAPFLGLRGLLQQAVARKDWVEAASLARRAEEAHPGAAWLREERAQLAIRTGAWKEALILAGPDAPRAAYAAAAAEAEPDGSEALRLARQAWQDDPRLTAAALVYAERLRATGSERRAETVLRDAWEAAPHPDLAAAALSGVGEKLARFKAAEKFTAGNPGHAESHLLLGRCALEAGLTGEARRHAEAARSMLDQRRVWMLLADIEEQEHGDGEAVRDALRHAAAAQPDPTWRCGACGTQHAAWHPVCSECGTPGRIAWESPAAAALQA